MTISKFPCRKCGASEGLTVVTRNELVLHSQTVVCGSCSEEVKLTISPLISADLTEADNFEAIEKAREEAFVGVPLDGTLLAVDSDRLATFASERAKASTRPQ